LIIEKRYNFIEGDYEVIGGIYTDEKGNIIMKSRYIKKLNWFKRLLKTIKI